MLVLIQLFWRKLRKKVVVHFCNFLIVIFPKEFGLGKYLLLSAQCGNLIVFLPPRFYRFYVKLILTSLLNFDFLVILYNWKIVELLKMKIWRGWTYKNWFHVRSECQEFPHCVLCLMRIVKLTSDKRISIFCFKFWILWMMYLLCNRFPMSYLYEFLDYGQWTKENFGTLCLIYYHE